MASRAPRENGEHADVFAASSAGTVETYHPRAVDVPINWLVPSLFTESIDRRRPAKVPSGCSKHSLPHTAWI